jgi:hypothetical protein
MKIKCKQDKNRCENYDIYCDCCEHNLLADVNPKEDCYDIRSLTVGELIEELKKLKKNKLIWQSLDHYIGGIKYISKMDQELPCTVTWVKVY